jgi:hypothetical protein
MQIVIDIPDYDYRQIKEYYEKNDIVEATYSYIYHGTPLPKGHGRLIDGDELESRMKIGYCIVKNTPTIIEADGGATDAK